MSAINETVERLKEKYGQKGYSKSGAENMALGFKEITRYRSGFKTFLSILEKHQPISKDLLRRAAIDKEDPLLVRDYLERFDGILLVCQNETCQITELGKKVLSEIKR